MHSIICIKQVPESARIRVRPLTNISERPSGDSHRSPRTALVGRGVRRRNHFPHSKTCRRTRLAFQGAVLIRARRALRRSRVRRRRLTAGQLCAGGRDPQEFAGDIIRPSLSSLASRSSIVSLNSRRRASGGLAHCSSRSWAKLGRRVSSRERPADARPADRRTVKAIHSRAEYRPSVSRIMVGRRGNYVDSAIQTGANARTFRLRLYRHRRQILPALRAACGPRLSRYSRDRIASGNRLRANRV